MLEQLELMATLEKKVEQLIEDNAALKKASAGRPTDVSEVCRLLNELLDGKDMAGMCGEPIQSVRVKISTLMQELKLRRNRDAKLVDIGHKHGWNGVENSKVLSVFFDDLIAGLKEKCARDERLA